MNGRDAISGAIRAAAAKGEPALVAFLTAGYPSREKFREHLQAVAAGADVVEIGVPFTDPMADGVTIQRSSHAALAQGVSLRWIFGRARGDAALEDAAAVDELPESPAGVWISALGDVAATCRRVGIHRARFAAR